MENQNGVRGVAIFLGLAANERRFVEKINFFGSLSSLIGRYSSFVARGAS